jgi:hypothetical protein
MKVSGQLHAPVTLLSVWEQLQVSILKAHGKCSLHNLQLHLLNWKELAGSWRRLQHEGDQIKEVEVRRICSTHANLKATDHAGNLGVDVKIILEWILEKSLGKCGLDSSGLRGTIGRLL